MNFVILVFATPWDNEPVQQVVGPFRSSENATNWVTLHGDDEKFYCVVKMEEP